MTPGNLQFKFKFTVDGNTADYNQMKYTNAAGNQYELTNIQWFISDVTLIDTSGSQYTIDDGNWIHYVDSDIPESQQWNIPGIQPGQYKGIMFVFGIKGEKNIPGMFTNPPESNMMWPYMMGGDFWGYLAMEHRDLLVILSVY